MKSHTQTQRYRKKNKAIIAVRKVQTLLKVEDLHMQWPRASGPELRQPPFDWKEQDKYNELNNFKINVRNIFMINSYNIVESKRVQIVMNWLDCERFGLVQTLPDKEWGKCQTSKGLFELLSEISKAQYSEAIF